MDSRKMLLLPAVVLVLQVYFARASCHDCLAPIPEVVVTIGGTFPGQEDFPHPSIHHSNHNLSPSIIYPDYVPPLAQQRQVIVLQDEGKNNNMDLLLLMLLTGQKDKTCHGKGKCGCHCHCCPHHHHHPPHH